MIGLMFPAAWFQPISVGAFTKGLGFPICGSMRSSLRSSRSAILIAAAFILRKQES